MKNVVHGRNLSAFRMFHFLSLAGLSMGFLLVLAGPVGAKTEDPDFLTTESCLDCHDDADIEGDTDRSATLQLYVAADALKGSVHEDLDCVDCHGNEDTFEDFPHNQGAPLDLLCAECHEDETEAYNASIHGLNYADGDKMAARCVDCHGGHQILPSTDKASTTYKFTLHETCATCHQNDEVLDTHEMGDEQAVGHYMDSIHGRALLVNGLSVAPSCNDCHGIHDILPSSHPKSRVHKNQVPTTCATCHVLVEEIYNASVHGQLLAERDPRGPVCTTCHSSHEISKPSSPEFRMESDQKCGECHEDRLERYRETFHGKAMALGRGEVATCYDCHGHHDIVEQANPLSRISDERRLETCQTCHPKATPNFADTIIHADHMDKEGFPQLYWTFLFMTVLLVGTFAFFAVHTVLWFFRSWAIFTRDSKEFRDIKKAAKLDKEEYIRFRPIDRFLHALVIFSFLLLVITGMPLKFYYTEWAQVMLRGMGGQHVAGVLHRVGAIITLFYFVVHVAEVLISYVRGRHRYRDPETGKLMVRNWLKAAIGPDSPMPNGQDLKDFAAHQKWFFGKGDRPQFDRWTYWEKFDYLAVFWGVAVIGFSGLIMWFPEFFTRWLPGWAVNVSLIVHSDEALLAAGFIFTFHFFNVHFRPEKFPMDPVIFSGKISKTELLHERKRLYDRWKKADELEEHKAGDQWEAWKKITLPAGFLAFCCGVLLLILILYAMFSRLLGGH